MSDLLLVEELAWCDVREPIVNSVLWIANHIWMHAPNADEVDRYMRHSIFGASVLWIDVFTEDLEGS